MRNFSVCLPYQLTKPRKFSREYTKKLPNPTATQRATDAQKAHYLALLDTANLTFEEIAKKVRVTHTTVARVLKNNDKQFASIETERRIFEEIDRRVDLLVEGLNKLRGFSN